MGRIVFLPKGKKKNQKNQSTNQPTVQDVNQELFMHKLLILTGFR
jgi:hypothetical protein